MIYMPPNNTPSKTDNALLARTNVSPSFDTPGAEICSYKRGVDVVDDGSS